uniref:BMA-MEC-9 n=1 Tax=Brugia malayi TaxID=6279 RepID=A0A0H5SAE1_BRUMA|nr:BMA-MEC-9 [Brugia malayi]
MRPIKNAKSFTTVDVWAIEIASIASNKVCLLDVHPGYCNDDRKGHWWYYFNATDGDCQRFFYYGCGGNDNRFYSHYHCEKMCGERLALDTDGTFLVTTGPSGHYTCECREGCFCFDHNFVVCDRCDVRTSICIIHSKYNYVCECREGFVKNVGGECVDLDECRNRNSVCDRNAQCVNMVGSYTCKCNIGYNGDGKKCTYVGIGRTTTNCAKCSPNAICSQGVCTCNIGFKGDGLNCTDIDECLSWPRACHYHAKCHNIKGSYQCECRSGYAGNGYNCTSAPSACTNSFDPQYSNQCGIGNWRPHYYYDYEKNRCRSFWYDGCPGKSMNIFSDANTCQVLCENLTDENLSNEFNRRATEYDYFKEPGNSASILINIRKNAKCFGTVDAARTPSTCSKIYAFVKEFVNICDSTCLVKPNHKCFEVYQAYMQEKLQTIRLESPVEVKQKSHQLTEALSVKLNSSGTTDNVINEDICCMANQCQSNATCYFNKTIQKYSCKCKDGQKDCIKKINKAMQNYNESDPCSMSVCKNGTTCIAKVRKDILTHECHNESRACDVNVNPCLNKTTNSYLTIFVIVHLDLLLSGRFLFINKTKPIRCDEKVELISIDKVEWIKQLKELKDKELKMKEIKKQNHELTSGIRNGSDQQMLHDSDNEDNMTDVNNTTNETIPTKNSLAAISLNDTAAGITIDTNHIRLSTIGLLTSLVWFQYLYQVAT